MYAISVSLVSSFSDATGIRYVAIFISHHAYILGLFAASLVIIHSSAYGGGGNGLFGLFGAVSGIILFVIYSLESYERASKSEDWSSISRLLLSISLLVIAVFYPSASLGYLFLIIFPVQMLCGAIVLAGLLKSGWKEPRFSKPYFLT